MMPRMSGVEVCQALRSNVELASSKVIMLSARAQQDDLSQGYSAGADDYIVKPFRPKDLVNRVEEELAHPGLMAVPDLRGTEDYRIKRLKHAVSSHTEIVQPDLA
jgi:DNA-binding response OmpR family regulator